MSETARQQIGTTLTAALLLCLSACSRTPVDEARGRCPDLLTEALELPALEHTSPGISSANLRTWVELLTTPTLEGRHAGEPGARAVADLLARQLADFDLEAPWPDEGYCQSFPFFDVEQSDVEDYNVIAHSGVESHSDRRRIVVGAHYDGQGKHPAGRIYPGADDNASGIAVLLELARLAADREADSRLGWVFAGLGAEEAGRLGSRAYLRNPSTDLSRVELVINLDMVGRPLPGEAPEAIGYLALGDELQETSALVGLAAAKAGLEVRDLKDFGDLRPAISDAEVFAARSPAVLLSTALHEDHHELTDVPERIDYAQVERATRLVLALADIIAGR